MITDKINIDFQVLNTNDPTLLSIADYSVWGQLLNKPSIIEVLLPGESIPRIEYFNQGQVNVFTSINLGLNCINDCGEVDRINLPDGIYTITLKGSPDTFNMTRKYLRTEIIQLELDKLYINLNLLCERKDEGKINKLTDIDLLLKAAASNVRHDNICEAQELFLKAQELIDKTKNC